MNILFYLLKFSDIFVMYYLLNHHSNNILIVTCIMCVIKYWMIKNRYYYFWNEIILFHLPEFSNSAHFVMITKNKNKDRLKISVYATWRSLVSRSFRVDLSQQRLRRRPGSERSARVNVDRLSRTQVRSANGPW